MKLQEKERGRAGSLMPSTSPSSPRVVEKNGNINVAIKRIKSWSIALWDYSILLRMNWVSFLTVSFLTFVISCIIFGSLIMQIRRVHSYPERMPIEERDAFLAMFNLDIFGPNILPVCFPEVENLGDAFLFSLETISTIGYGTKYPNPVCPEAVIITMAMSFWSLLLTALFVAIFLAKFTLRTGTSRIRFSSKALMGQIDGSLFLMFRIADPMASGSDIVEVNAFVTRPSHESSDHLHHRVKLDHLGRLACSCTLQVRAHSRIPLMWPLVIYHKVGELSPLYTLHPEHLDKERFEIIVKVSGVRSESGGTIFSTTSYTNTELSWGQRFDENYVLFRHQDGSKEEEAFNMASFGQEDIDQANTSETPLISAQAMAEAKQEETAS